MPLLSEEEDAEEESMKPAAVNACAAVAVEGVDAEADACAKAEDVLVEELMKTADAHDIVGVKNEGDE